MAELRITEPGVYDKVSHDAYHADPCPERSLSSSAARRLLETCPSRFRYELDHPRPPTVAFDIGGVAHDVLLLGETSVAVIDAPDWRTGSAKGKRDEAREAVKTPLLSGQWEGVQAMLAALEAHPFAHAAFRNGKPEQTLIWRDEMFDIWKRARLDWLPNTGGAFFADYKTCLSAHPEDLRKAMFDHGYYQQAAHYLDGIKSLGLSDRPAFIFVFQEKDPPYEVVVVQPDEVAVEWGRIRNRKASEIFARCVHEDHWPGYAEDVLTLDLPEWGQRRLEAQHGAGAFEIIYRPAA